MSGYGNGFPATPNSRRRICSRCKPIRIRKWTVSWPSGLPMRLTIPRCGCQAAPSRGPDAHWDGVITTGSVAAEIVDAGKQALWPLVLEPKLGSDWVLYDWQDKNFVQEEMVEKAPQEWLPANYKSWDDLIAAAVEKGMLDHHAPPSLQLDLRQPACDRCKASVVRTDSVFSSGRAPGLTRLRATRPRSITCGAAWRQSAAYGGLEQCGWIDGKHCDGRVGGSG